MSTFTADTTLADIVTARPSLARVLEARGFDYCCGGTATLGDACAVRQLDVDTVLAELAASADGIADESAPAWAASRKCSMVPAPPEATMGTLTT